MIWLDLPSVKPFGVSLRRIAPAVKTSLVARHRILMRLHTAILAPSHRAQGQNIADLIPAARHQILGFPPEGEVRGRDDLDKVHIIERRIVRHLLGPVKRVDVMVRPGRALRAQFLRHTLRDLRPKSQLVDLMRKGVSTGDGGIQVVVQVMDMHRTTAEAAAWRNVEIPNDFINAEAAFDPAPLLPLRVQLFGIMHSFALLYILPASKRP